MADKEVNRMFTYMKIFFAVIFLLVIYYGFFKPVPLGIDNTVLYQAIHPFRFEDFLGLLGLLFYAFVLAGMIKPVQRFIEPRSENSIGMSWIVFVIAVVFIIIMLADR